MRMLLMVFGSTRRFVAFPFFIAILLLSPISVQAVTYTNVANGAWSMPGIWANSIKPPDGGEPDAIIRLTGTPLVTNDLPGAFMLNGLQHWQNTGNLYGNPLLFANSNAAITSTSGGSPFYIYNNLILATNLYVNGVAGAVTIQSNISETVLSGITLVVGTLSFASTSTTNTYTGKTIALSGTLQFGAPLSNTGVAGPLGSPTGANAVIDLYPGSSFIYNGGQGSITPPHSSTDRTINLAGAGPGTVTLNGNNINDTGFRFGGFTATGTGTRTLQINCKGDRPVYTYTGGIPDMSDSSMVTVSVSFSTSSSAGNGAVYLNGVNTFTGPLIINNSYASAAYFYIGGAGMLGNGSYNNTISIGGNSIFNYASPEAQTLSGVISGAGALTLNGSGTLTLSASNTYSGVTTVNSGTLVLDFVNAGSGAVLVNSTLTNALSGGTLLVKCKSGAFSATQTAGDVSVGTGGGAILGNANGGTSVTITLGALPNVTATGSSFLAGTAGANTNGLSITTTGGGTLTDGMFNGREVWCSSVDSSYDWLTQTGGPGTYTLAGLDNSTLTDLPTSGGSSTVNYKMTTAKTLGGSFSVKTLKLEAPNGALDIAGNTLTISGNGLLCTGSTNVNITGVAGTGLSAGELVVHQYNTGGLTVSATIGSGTVLTKSGSGVLTLMTNNTLGVTYINGGTLEIGGNGRLSSGNHGQSIAFSGNSSGLLKYSSSSSQALGGVISGNGGITVCNGTLTLTNANTFVRQVTVQSGTLSVSSINNASANGPLGNSSSAVIMGYADGSTGTLQLTTTSSATSSKPFLLATGGGGIFNIVNSVTQTITGVVSGGGSLNKTGPGTLILSGSNTLSGDVTVTAGKLSIANACLSSGSTVTIGSGASLDLNFSGTNVIRLLSVNGQVKSANFYTSSSGVQITGSGVLRSLFPVSGTVITVR